MADNTDLLQQIRKIVQEENEPLKQGQKATNKRLSTLGHGQAHLTTAVEAIGAGQQDILKRMATKQDVEATIGEARAELRTDIPAIDKKLVRKVQSHENRIDQLERDRGLSNPDKH